MVRNILKITVLLVLLLSLNSCEKLLEGSTLISGNQKYRSGKYQEAILGYLKGYYSKVNGDYFYYNLGNVYTALGEYPSAFSVWSLADGGNNPMLHYNLLYNMGFLKFQLGDYEEAYDLFKRALILQPSSIKAKINLELSLNKMSAANFSQNPDDKPSGDDQGASDETTRILEYVRQKENMTWGSEDQDHGLENDW